MTREEKDDVRFLLSLLPDWAEGEVPEGLDPMFYGTGSAEGDRDVKRRVDEIRAKVEGETSGVEKVVEEMETIRTADLDASSLRVLIEQWRAHLVGERC